LLRFIVIFVIASALGVGWVLYDSIANFGEYFMSSPWFVKALACLMFVSSFQTATHERT